MSVEAMTWAYEQNVDSALAKFILITLANHAHPDGVTFVGQAFLAERCSLSVRSVRKQEAYLDSLDLIGRLQRARENGSRTSDWIVLGPGMGRRRAPMRAPDPDEYRGRDRKVVELAMEGKRHDVPEAQCAGSQIELAEPEVAQAAPDGQTYRHDVPDHNRQKNRQKEQSDLSLQSFPHDARSLISKIERLGLDDRAARSEVAWALAELAVPDAIAAVAQLPDLLTTFAPLEAARRAIDYVQRTNAGEGWTESLRAVGQPDWQPLVRGMEAVA